MSARGVTAPAFALGSGLFYVALGILGMLPSLVLPDRDSIYYGYFLGLFAVNTPLNALHAFMGMWGLTAWAGALSAVTFGRVLALVMGLLALAGLVPGAQVLFDVLPLFGHNVWLHGLTALAGAWVGWRSLVRRELAGTSSSPLKHGERRGRVSDRRQALRPVAQERRRGPSDRRQAPYGGTTIPAG